MKRILFLSFNILVLVSLSGCANFAKKWKALITDEQPQAVAQTPAQKQNLSYSDQSNVIPNVYRNYQRTSKKDFEDKALVDSRAGSLWVMEGQGSYLFAQNVVRMIGDPVSIKLEGEPKNQLSKKAEVISTLLKQLDERRNRAYSRGPASDKTDAAAVDNSNPTAAPPAAAAAAEEPAKDAASALAVNQVPTRITERLVDGNYRVQGMQPFMIGNREYKVIVSGIVKSEDFNDNGISASQLLDPSFDIVSSKSAEM